MNTLMGGMLVSVSYVAIGVSFVCICQKFDVPIMVLEYDAYWLKYHKPMDDIERGVGCLLWPAFVLLWLAYLIIGKPLGLIFRLTGKAISLICKN